MGHLLRINAVIHQVIQQVDSEGEMVALSQQGWLLAAELWHKMNDQRKSWSILGSLEPEDNVLFKKEDLMTKSTQEKIDRASRLNRPLCAKYNSTFLIRFNRP